MVLAAGAGERFGQRKQFLKLGGVRLVDHSVETMSRVCAGLVLVLPSGSLWDGRSVDDVVEGGATRIDSASQGLAAVPPDVQLILVHDAAHPLAPTSLMESLIEAVRQEGVDAALPVLPTRDTVMRVEGDRVVETIPRRGLVTVQTPQAFRANVLRRAHERGGDASDDSVLVQRMGANIKLVAGDPRNIHIATKEDLAMAERLCR
ncbi:MAG: IspD/TarI family cytidylyltransferase [Actinomycetota bacterium]